MLSSRSIKAHGLASVGLFVFALSVGGCSAPSKANIELRKQNAELQRKVDEFDRMRKADSARRAVTTGPATPTVDLDNLYTTHGLGFGRLTGVSNASGDPGGSVLKVYVTPSDQKGDDLKAAGGFDVSAIDTSRDDNPLVGKWTFSAEQAAKAWAGKGLLYCYVLECPLPTAFPADHKLTVRVVFHDALTGRSIEAEKSDARVFK